LSAIRKLGRFVEFSVFGAPTTVDWSIIGDRKELDLLGAHLSPYCFQPVINWITEGKLATEGVVTHKFALDEWEKHSTWLVEAMDPLKSSSFHKPSSHALYK